MIEQGPDGRLHVPNYQKGCYYNRPFDCCWFCIGRMAFSVMTSLVQQRLMQTQHNHDHDGCHGNHQTKGIDVGADRDPSKDGDESHHHYSTQGEFGKENGHHNPSQQDEDYSDAP